MKYFRIGNFGEFLIGECDRLPAKLNSGNLPDKVSPLGNKMNKNELAFRKDQLQARIELIDDLESYYSEVKRGKIKMPVVSLWRNIFHIALLKPERAHEIDISGIEFKEDRYKKYLLKLIAGEDLGDDEYVLSCLEMAKKCTDIDGFAADIEFDGMLELIDAKKGIKKERVIEDIENTAEKNHDCGCISFCEETKTFVINIDLSHKGIHPFGYNIGLVSANSEKKLLEWVFHICEKAWCTPRVISDLINCVSNYFNFKVGQYDNEVVNFVREKYREDIGLK